MIVKLHTADGILIAKRIPYIMKSCNKYCNYSTLAFYENIYSFVFIWRGKVHAGHGYFSPLEHKYYIRWACDPGFDK